MYKLRKITRTERVDFCVTALIVFMLVHVCFSLGLISMLFGLLVAAAYVYYRPRLRRMREAGRETVAWAALRIFETGGVALLVFVLASQPLLSLITVFYGPETGVWLGNLAGVALAVSFLVFRAVTWRRQFQRVETSDVQE
jgi:predicted histidine transporter YuiF (NhaC family)